MISHAIFVHTLLLAQDGVVAVQVAVQCRNVQLASHLIGTLKLSPNFKVHCCRNVY